MSRARFVLYLGLLVCLPTLQAFGHDSPEHVVEHLTRLMERRGRSPELLYRRATEYRVLGKLEHATVDLQSALELDDKYLAAHLELSRILLDRNEPEQAGAALDRAKSLANSPADQALVHMIRCDIFLAQRQPEAALRECEQACALRPGEVEWLLQRSRIEAELGRHEARIRNLESARKQNPSVVLQIELIEAQIDGRKLTEALGQIETELADSRWRSSWLIRRARVRRQMSDDSGAHSDLRAAIAEINERLSPTRPDVSLLLDRGTAYAMLGDIGPAQADLRAARARGASSWSTQRLESLLVPRSFANTARD